MNSVTNRSLSQAGLLNKPAFGQVESKLRWVPIIEIGLERARFVVLVLFFFSSFECAKNLLIMGPINTKNCS